METNDEQNNPSKPHYKWPWFVLAFVILGIVLAVFWMAKEVQRTRSYRDLNAPLPGSK